MKEPLNRTKVVIRHLPPTLSHSAFFDQIDARFSSRYNWSSFVPGKSSYKNQRHARAYINFNRPDDVFEFAEFFGGHVFVNEKGTQYKATVEYAPSQRVPKPNAKKDGREGTIYKDPEYVEFLEKISKPVENLPSADIQLERREAERAGVQEAPIVTPLMEFVRKKRAAKSGNLVGGRSRVGSPGKARSSKLVSEKKKYVLKSSGKSANGKDKSTYVLVPQRESQLDVSSKKGALGNETGSVSHDATKKRIVLLKGKEQGFSQVSDGSTQSKVVSTAAESKGASTAAESSPPVSVKFNQRHDASGRIIRSILLNKEGRHSQSSSSIISEQKLHTLDSEKSKRPPRAANVKASGQFAVNDQSPPSSDYVGRKSVDDRTPGNEVHALGPTRDRQDRRTRSRDRLDRGVWTPRRSDSSHTGDGYHSNILDSYEGKRVDSHHDVLQSGRSGEITGPTGGRSSSYTENGSHRSFGRRGPAQGGKDDGSSKRGGTIGHALHEKQVWVQKSASGS